MWEYQHTDELYHYGVLGMKWGIRRARKTGGTYQYTSHGTKKYRRKAERARARGNLESASKWERRAERSAELDKAMQDNAAKSGVGKTVAKTLFTNSRTYEATKAYLSKYNTASALSIGLAYVNSYVTGPFGATPLRYLYVREGEK